MQDRIFLSDYKRNRASLTTRVAAKRIWDRERLVERGILQVDFGGINSTDISQEFLVAFFDLDQPHSRVAWLRPVNYSKEVERMLEPYFQARHKIEWRPR